MGMCQCTTLNSVICGCKCEKQRGGKEVDNLIIM